MKRRILLTGILVTLADLTFGAIGSELLFPGFGLTEFSREPGVALVVGILTSAFAYSMLYTLCYTVFNKALMLSGIKKGVTFALIIWLSFCVTREFWNMVIYTIPLTAVISGIGTGLLQHVSGGIIMVKLLDKK